MKNFTKITLALLCSVNLSLATDVEIEPASIFIPPNLLLKAQQGNRDALSQIQNRMRPTVINMLVEEFGDTPPLYIDPVLNADDPSLQMSKHDYKTTQEDIFIAANTFFANVLNGSISQETIQTCATNDNWQVRQTVATALFMLIKKGNPCAKNTLLLLCRDIDIKKRLTASITLTLLIKSENEWAQFHLLETQSNITNPQGNTTDMIALFRLSIEDNNWAQNRPRNIAQNPAILTDQTPNIALNWLLAHEPDWIKDKILLMHKSKNPNDYLAGRNSLGYLINENVVWAITYFNELAQSTEPSQREKTELSQREKAADILCKALQNTDDLVDEDGESIETPGQRLFISLVQSDNHNEQMTAERALIRFIQENITWITDDWLLPDDIQDDKKSRLIRLALLRLAQISDPGEDSDLYSWIHSKFKDRTFNVRDNTPTEFSLLNLIRQITANPTENPQKFILSIADKNGSEAHDIAARILLRLTQEDIQLVQNTINILAQSESTNRQKTAGTALYYLENTHNEWAKTKIQEFSLSQNPHQNLVAVTALSKLIRESNTWAQNQIKELSKSVIARDKALAASVLYRVLTTRNRGQSQAARQVLGDTLIWSNDLFIEFCKSENQNEAETARLVLAKFMPKINMNGHRWALNSLIYAAKTKNTSLSDCLPNLESWINSKAQSHNQDDRTLAIFLMFDHVKYSLDELKNWIIQKAISSSPEDQQTARLVTSELLFRSELIRTNYFDYFKNHDIAQRTKNSINTGIEILARLRLSGNTWVQEVIENNINSSKFEDQRAAYQTVLQMADHINIENAQGIEKAAHILESLTKKDDHWKTMVTELISSQNMIHKSIAAHVLANLNRENVDWALEKIQELEASRDHNELDTLLLIQMQSSRSNPPPAKKARREDQ